MQDFGVTKQEIQKIAGELPKIKAALPEILKEFYDWAASNPELAKILGDSNQNTGILAEKQLNHWLDLLRNGPDESFRERSRIIGEIHHKIGLTPEWYLAGYARILGRLCETIGKGHRFSGGSAAESIGIISKLLLLDIQSALDVYINADTTASSEASKNQFAHDMMDSTVQVSMAINESAISSVRMQYAIEKVNEQAQTISAAVEETVVGIQQISENSDQVSQIAREANERTNSGNEIVSNAAQKMDTITDVVFTTSKLVNELSESSKQIGEIVQTIEDIANQTNLLALNATIEAARAGEAGKGFAVVANEVKSLSSQTGKATDEIRNRIQALVSNMGEIVSSMDEASEAVTVGQSAMNEASSTMTEINRDVEDVAVRMDQISQILQEQSQASNEVASGVSSIAHESNVNVNSLDQLRTTMNQVVGDIGQQLSNFFEYDIPHKVIRIAKSDHVIWKKRLVDMLSGKESLRADELADHRQCRLGKFYYGPQAAMYRDLAPFKQLETPHAEVHRQGIEAVKMYNAGNIDGALEAVEKVEAASEEVLRLLDEVTNQALKFKSTPDF